MNQDIAMVILGIGTFTAITIMTVAKLIIDYKQSKK